MSLHTFLRNTKPPLALPLAGWLFSTGARSTCKETVHTKERETGLEPATACLEGRNSTRLSYSRLTCLWSGCADSNRGPHGPKPCALPTAPHPANALFNHAHAEAI